jgi:glutamine---fructose-6-phosphate transaminase (isomerizing)
MCGIVGYVGQRPVQDLLLAGLEKLEYRGYDSAGISMLADGHVESVRAVGNLGALREAVAAAGGNGGVAVAAKPATTGIGHTRWATHGRVSEANAHPHFDTGERIHIVLNGIVENFTLLRDRLIAEGARFTSETDAEVVAHLIASHYDGDLIAAVRDAYAELQGHYAFVAMAGDEPELLVAARKECPLIVGRGDGEQFFASAIPAFLKETRRVQQINNDEIVAITPDGARFFTSDGTPIEREIEEVTWDEDTAEKGGHATFMSKEIHEQADAVAETIADRTVRPDGVDLGDLGAIDDDFLREARRIVVVACGTSYHAGLVGRYAIEEWARVPVEMDIASEYRYRNPVVGPGDLVVGISQSGETADTLAAMRLARERGARVLAISNVMGSQATRDADATLFTRAGLEIGVAATKTFVCQVAAMYLLGLRIAELRGTIEPDRMAELVTQLKRMPHCIDELIEACEEQINDIAHAHHKREFFLYLGRHVGLPVALEGALKLKEISYIHAEAYAAGELKHGPLALVDSDMPVVAVAPNNELLEKLKSNLMEVRARGGELYVFADPDAGVESSDGVHVIQMPKHVSDFQAPIIYTIPLQLLAYHVAMLRGTDVDQPRNLAKSVTVE